MIMVGEIRDNETARIAVQAALTGHLVLSTLHTNDAASSVTRLVNIGIEPYLIAASMNAAAGPASGPPDLHQVQGAVQGPDQMRKYIREGGQQAERDRPRSRLRRLSRLRVRRPGRHLRAAGHRRQVPRHDQPGHFREQHAPRVPRERPRHPLRRRHQEGASRGSPRSRRSCASPRCTGRTRTRNSSRISSDPDAIGLSGQDDHT